MSLITMGDIAQTRAVTPLLRGVLLDDVLVKPELSRMNVKLKPTATYEKLVQTKVGTAGFRETNEGTPDNTKPEFEVREVNTAYTERETSYDIKLLSKFRAGSARDRVLADTRRKFLQDSVEATNRLIVSQIWYGRENKTNGFSGMHELIFPNRFHPAGGSTADQMRSAFMIQSGDSRTESGISIVFGENSPISLRFATWQVGKLEDENQKKYTGHFNETYSQPGVEYLSLNAAGHIGNIDVYGSGSAFTDDLVHTAVTAFWKNEGIDPRTAPNWLIFVPVQLKEDLRKWRNSTSNGGQTVRKTEADPAPSPSLVADIPMVTTPSLLETEKVVAA